MAKLEILSGVVENLNVTRESRGKYGSIHTGRFTVTSVPIEYQVQFGVLQKETFPIAEGDKITVVGHMRDATGMVGKAVHIERTNQFLGQNWLLPACFMVPCAMGTLFVAASSLGPSARSAPGHWDAYALGIVGVALAAAGLWLTFQAWRTSAMLRAALNDKY